MDEEDRAAAGTEHPYLSGERLQCAVKIGCPYSLLMSRDFDYSAEAEEAMREAAAATTAVERIKWVIDTVNPVVGVRHSAMSYYLMPD